MAIKYDIYASPVPSGSQREPNYHARVVGSRTVDMQEVIDHIHGRCTLTKGDLKAAFAELSEEIVNCLVMAIPFTSKKSAISAFLYRPLRICNRRANDVPT